MPLFAQAVARTCDVVFTMLAHDAAVREVATQLATAFAAAGAAASGAGAAGAVPRILVDCSTVRLCVWGGGKGRGNGGGGDF